MSSSVGHPAGALESPTAAGRVADAIANYRKSVEREAASKILQSGGGERIEFVVPTDDSPEHGTVGRPKSRVREPVLDHTNSNSTPKSATSAADRREMNERTPSVGRGQNGADGSASDELLGQHSTALEEDRPPTSATGSQERSGRRTVGLESDEKTEKTVFRASDQRRSAAAVSLRPTAGLSQSSVAERTRYGPDIASRKYSVVSTPSSSLRNGTGSSFEETTSEDTSRTGDDRCRADSVDSNVTDDVFLPQTPSTDGQFLAVLSGF